MPLAGCPEGALINSIDDPGTGDICADNGWYNDGECDTFCPLPDPDCDTQPPDAGGVGTVTFENGGVNMNATTTESAAAKTTTITEGGQELLILETTVDGVRVIFPGEGGVEEESTFTTPLDELPSDFATNRLAAYIVAQVYFDPESDVRPDNPGCDWFPDTRCTLRCCADHDRCFAANNCGASSWIPFVGSAACNNCNAVVWSCILHACANGLEGDPSTDVCFDAACGASYTCPEFNCDCATTRAPRGRAHPADV